MYEGAVLFEPEDLPLVRVRPFFSPACSSGTCDVKTNSPANKLEESVHNYLTVPPATKHAPKRDLEEESDSLYSQKHQRLDNANLEGPERLSIPT